jgi:hypothetical protein
MPYPVHLVPASLAAPLSFPSVRIQPFSAVFALGELSRLAFPALTDQAYGLSSANVIPRNISKKKPDHIKTSTAGSVSVIASNIDKVSENTNTRIAFAILRFLKKSDEARPEANRINWIVTAMATDMAGTWLDAISRMASK